MTSEEILDAWSPATSRWSQWAKPVLFAHIGRVAEPNEPPSEEGATVVMSPEELRVIGSADGSTAIVVDLPDNQSVKVGITLANAGYRPVPLYNSVPVSDSGPGDAPNVAVQMGRILKAINTAADELKALPIAADAPPAFLLDSRRRVAVALKPGAFDNRSVSLPTDFPSANFLLSNGIKRVIVVLAENDNLQTDLAHTLRRWQQAGVEMFSIRHKIGAQPAPLTISRPPYFRHIWYGLLATMGLTRGALGGFGGYLPMPSGG